MVKSNSKSHFEIKTKSKPKHIRKISLLDETSNAKALKHGFARVFDGPLYRVLRMNLLLLSGTLGLNHLGMKKRFAEKNK